MNDEENKNFLLQLGLASSVGFAMVIAIFGSLLLGSYLDRKFNTGYKLTLTFLIIGVSAGLRNIYTLIKRSFPDNIEPERYVNNEPHKKRSVPKKT